MKQKLLALIHRPIDMVTALLDGFTNKYVRNTGKLIMLIVIIVILYEIGTGKEKGFLDQAIAKLGEVMNMVGAQLKNNGLWVTIIAVLYFTLRKDKPA